MAIEAKRGCGYRVCGALYLVADKPSWACGRLPLPTAAPYMRTLKMTTLPVLLAPTEHLPCRRVAKDEHGAILQALGADACPTGCWARWPPASEEPVALMWVGEAGYTPASFLREALDMGLSKRVPSLPQAFVLGSTQVFLAHKAAYPYERCFQCGAWKDGVILDGAPRTSVCPTVPSGQHQYDGPGLFCGFTPHRVECLVEDDRLQEPWVQALRDKDVTIIEVPHDDPDHARQPAGTGKGAGATASKRRQHRGLDRLT